MTFDYLSRVVVDASLDIDDICNCCIQAFNDAGEKYYLNICTDWGVTEIFEYGPVLLSDEPRKSILWKYNRFDTDNTKIAKRIDDFLNNSHRLISQAMIVDKDVLISDLTNPLELLQC